MHIWTTAFTAAVNRPKNSSSTQSTELAAQSEKRVRLLNNLEKFNFQLQPADLQTYYQKIREYSTEPEHSYGDKTPKKVSGLKYTIHHVSKRHFISRPLDGFDYPKKASGRHLEVAIDLKTGDPFIKKEVRRKEVREWVEQRRPKLDGYLGQAYEIEARILNRTEQVLVSNLHRESINHQTLKKNSPMYYLKRHEHTNNEKHYIYLPYVEGEDLFELFQQQKITNTETLKALKSSIELVRNLHEKALIWGDYMLENIVYDPEKKQVSLIDFESLRSFSEAESTQDFWGSRHNTHMAWLHACQAKGSYNITPKNDHYAVLKTIMYVMQAISSEIEDHKFHVYYSNLSARLAIHAVGPLQNCPGLDELEAILDEAIVEVAKYESQSCNRCKAWCCIA